MVLGRFYTVGLACALLHNAIMIGGDWVGLHYVVSSLVSFAIVTSSGYWLHSAWTFPGVRRGSIPFARYVLTIAANLPLSIAGMFVLVDLAALSVLIAAPVVTVVLAAYNFIGARWALRAQARSKSA
jgi:putative flippase GtrA